MTVSFVHLAAQPGMPGSLVDPRRDCEVNVIGTLNMLEAVRAEQERRGEQIRFVFASSNAPFGQAATARHRGQGSAAYLALRGQETGRGRILLYLSRSLGTGNGCAAFRQPV